MYGVAWRGMSCLDEGILSLGSWVLDCRRAGYEWPWNS